MEVAWRAGETDGHEGCCGTWVVKVSLLPCMLCVGRRTSFPELLKIEGAAVSLTEYFGVISDLVGCGYMQRGDVQRKADSRSGGRKVK